jgi:hypothetical protein
MKEYNMFKEKMKINSFEDEFNENETQEIIDSMIIDGIIAWVLQIDEYELPEIKYLREAINFENIKNINKNVRRKLISKIRRDIEAWKLIRPQFLEKLLPPGSISQFLQNNYYQEDLSDLDF